jgi:hypothetical protein
VVNYGTAEQKPLRALISLNAQYRHRFTAKLPFSYDQIAWFTQGRAQLINMQLLSAGGVDFVDHLYRDVGMTKAQMQYRVSDHYPLWVEFGQ